MRLMNLNRIKLLVICCLVTIFLWLPLLKIPFDKASAAQSEEARIAKLAEGARKEGKLLWYVVLSTPTAEKYRKEFQKKYPYIKFTYYRSGEERQMTRILSEARAKKHAFDVVTTNAFVGELLKKKRLLAKYHSPQRDFYPEGIKDPEGYWTSIYDNLGIIGYNTKLVSPREAPKTWNDLLDPKWKGKMGMDVKAYYWFASMLKIMGEEKGLEYMKNLSDQNIRFRNGRTLNAQLLAAGEMSIGICLYNHRIEDLKGKGAPVEWIAIEPVVPTIHPLALSAHAPHPNAAKLFMEFMLSREGQEILKGDFYIPSRMDVKALIPSMKEGLKILPFNPSILEDYDRYVNLYRNILMKMKK
ncbi:ABC transporter substrate-binding protein [Thermodesulfobacteriota bacterium]